MVIMKKHIFTSILAAVSFMAAASAQTSYTFDGEVGLEYSGLKKGPELVEGFSGKGVRTDGYSTWYKTSSATEVNSVKGISLWCALETYPVDTAGFFGVRDVHGKTLSACVDRFGKVMVGVGNGESGFKYIPTFYKADKFEWMNIGLSFHQKEVEIYINGTKMQLEKVIPTELGEISEVIIGKDFREKNQRRPSSAQNNRPVTYTCIVNGILDEVRLYDGGPDFGSIRKEYASTRPHVPSLAIPASRFEGDLSRPQFHLLPSANWTNETHGLIYYHGKYHIFNQKNGTGLSLTQMNWGHFSSPDLIHWTEEKPALSPTPGYDSDGDWSGHAIVDDNDLLTLFYTTGKHSPQGDKMGVGLAYPLDYDATEFVKYEGNPIIEKMPEGYTRTDMRDQYVWKESDGWYMIIGFGVVEEGIEKGAVLLYKSQDLKNWTSLGTMYESDPEHDKSFFWEMPIFVKLGEKYVLLVNTLPQPARAQYWVGDFKDGRFIPDSPVPQQLDVINHLLSPSFAFDKDGNPTVIGIVADGMGVNVPATTRGWTHLFSLPRKWALENNKIVQSPHPAIQSLRDEHKAIDLKLKAGESVKITDDCHASEIKVTFKPRNASKFGVIIYKNDEDTEGTKFYYNAETQEFTADREKSASWAPYAQRFKEMQNNASTSPNMRRRMSPTVSGPYPMGKNQPLEFNIFVDNSVIDIFLNGKDAFGYRVSPSSTDSYRMDVFCEGGSVTVKGDFWTMKPAPVKANF